jgi:hypothetical protein
MIKLIYIFSTLYAAKNPNEMIQRSSFSPFVINQNYKTEEDPFCVQLLEFMNAKGQKIKNFNQLTSPVIAEYNEIWEILIKKDLTEKSLLRLISRAIQRKDYMFFYLMMHMYEKPPQSINFIREIFLKNSHSEALKHFMFYMRLKDIKFQKQDIIFFIYHAWKDPRFVPLIRCCFLEEADFDWEKEILEFYEVFKTQNPVITFFLHDKFTEFLIAIQNNLQSESIKNLFQKINHDLFESLKKSSTLPLVKQELINIVEVCCEESDSSQDQSSQNDSSDTSFSFAKKKGIKKTPRLKRKKNKNSLHFSSSQLNLKNVSGGGGACGLRAFYQDIDAENISIRERAKNDLLAHLEDENVVESLCSGMGVLLVDSYSQNPNIRTVAFEALTKWIGLLPEGSVFKEINLHDSKEILEQELANNSSFFKTQAVVRAYIEASVSQSNYWLSEFDLKALAHIYNVRLIIYSHDKKNILTPDNNGVERKIYFSHSHYQIVE